MLYRAFISYSHADEKTARWLMRRLESYRVPANLVGSKGRDGPIPAKLGKFFRDRDELPSAGNLSKTINDALEKSHALIVICSPASAQSQWVNAEIDAFRQSGHEDNIFSFIVAGDPASRDPADASFPYALLKPDAEGEPEREPLAADARKQGDGPDRAFLKLVAGLLGVGFDDLAQREAQQRHKRMAYITGFSLLGMTLAVVLAVTAYVARNDAERRQAQAEDIIGFMLGDLRKNLTKVGRLDLMRSVDDKATGYFATLDPRDLSDRALEEQARSLTGIGEVRVNEGNHKEAMIAFREAHARSTALYERAPENGQRLFDLAQAEYWIGFVAWQQGNFEDAALWLGKYRDSGVKLAAMDRTNFDWQKEAAYGYNNIAVLDESLGKYEQAEKSMLAVRDLYVDWLKQYPKDLQLRADFANKVSWLGSIYMQQGKLQKAEANFVELNNIFESNMRDEPNNIIWKEQRLHALQLLSEVQIKLGRSDAVIANNGLAFAIADELVTKDPKNNGWRLAYGVVLYRQATQSTQNQYENLNNAANVLQVAHNTEPKNVVAMLWLSRALLDQGGLALSKSETNLALNKINAIHTLIEPFLETGTSDRVALSQAQLHILEGETFLNLNDKESAMKKFEQAYAILHDESKGEISFVRLEDLVRVMYLMGKKLEATEYKQRLDKSGYVSQNGYP